MSSDDVRFALLLALVCAGLGAILYVIGIVLV